MESPLPLRTPQKSSLSKDTLRYTMTGPSTVSSHAAASIHTPDHVSAEQYRYALTNFVRTFIQHIILLTDLLIPHMDSLIIRPSHIRRSKNSGLNSKSRSGRSHGSKHASQRSRARPPTHPPQQARVLRAVAPSTISPSRYAVLYCPSTESPHRDLHHHHHHHHHYLCARTRAQNTASQLERTINRWAGEVLRLAPAPPAAVQDAALADVAGAGDTTLFTEARPMMVQSLLRHAMSEAISEGIINCLIVTSSAETNIQLTRIHEHLFARKSILYTLRAFFFFLIGVVLARS